MTQKQRSKKLVLVNIETLKAGIAKMEAMEPKQPKEIPLKDAIGMAAEVAQGMLSKGFTLAEVHEELKEVVGIDVATSTIALYFREALSKLPEKPRKSRRRRAAASSTDQQDTAAPSTDMPVENAVKTSAKEQPNAIAPYDGDAAKTAVETGADEHEVWTDDPRIEEYTDAGAVGETPTDPADTETEPADHIDDALGGAVKDAAFGDIAASEEDSGLVPPDVSDTSDDQLGAPMTEVPHVTDGEQNDDMNEGSEEDVLEDRGDTDAAPGDAPGKLAEYMPMSVTSPGRRGG
ncbi:hypothetical protein EU805_15845 [Salipiger sp. IMCC34102]|uniref:hypothetical protein n=1 Tax=Salipiger sp. IMCC34102 TaxID=2510647 RepID=UPI00101DC077|nr:hypothetical protein [Salipiger sp. IMCC34102]RYH01068.1 hypothetical protein EU805_15845 [Salipiger sp. IMCC34102]